jgi:hypothetical protein
MRPHSQLSDEEGTRQMTINDVRTKYEEQLMNLPNVTGVGVGEKEGKEVIKVFVKQKVPEAALRPEEIVPQRLEGFEVDVEEIGEVTAQDR